MATFKQLLEVNQRINKVDIKGKQYAQVADRVMAFRELYPDGAILTDLISNEGGMAVVKATILNEGQPIATGLAYEKESSSFINKTSYIENCETSAVGRALGFLGIGSDENICSAEELANAVRQQNQQKTIKKTEAKAVATMVEELHNNGKLNKDKVLLAYGVYSYDQLTYDQYDDLLAKLRKL